MHRLSDAAQITIEGHRPTYVERLRVPNLSVGSYSIPVGGADPQEPHTEDEIYVVMRGTATLRTPTNEEPAAPGDVFFVPAGEVHRFEDVTQDLCVLVVFGPAEHTLAATGEPAPGGRE